MFLPPIPLWIRRILLQERRFESPQSTPISTTQGDEHKVLQQISELIDERLQQLEDQALKPLKATLEALSERCDQYETTLNTKDIATLTSCSLVPQPVTGAADTWPEECQESQTSHLQEHGPEQRTLEVDERPTVIQTLVPRPCHK